MAPRMTARAKRVEIPQAFVRLAEDRTAFLQPIALDHPLRYLLACAYFQGINDVVEVIDRRGTELLDRLNAVAPIKSPEFDGGFNPDRP